MAWSFYMVVFWWDARLLWLPKLLSASHTQSAAGGEQSRGAQAQRPGRPKRPLFPGRPVPIPSPRPQPARTRSFSQRESPLTRRPLCLVVRSRPTQSQSHPGFFFFLGSYQLLKCSKHPPPVQPLGSGCYCPAAGWQISALSFPVAPLRSRASKRCPRDRGLPRLAARVVEGPLRFLLASPGNAALPHCCRALGDPLPAGPGLQVPGARSNSRAPDGVVQSGEPC
ncbi:hypothetical protein NDU88_000050 [Pleurodeles waltl]|uniref:Secreted protein n=1 Tax=Pleurodeles waltl TaxID=8319 RepID=A0AAV7TFY5_PLEWA|nr:hypothetical protein NDU88_000049 [Pleurodeles waltl]KAJ1174758.1 hypothetical protein NDU88_000050 [Pleurodeles waltl]